MNILLLYHHYHHHHHHHHLSLLHSGLLVLNKVLVSLTKHLLFNLLRKKKLFNTWHVLLLLLLLLLCSANDQRQTAIRSYEISTKWETKPRATPHKSSRQLMDRNSSRGLQIYKLIIIILVITCMQVFTVTYQTQYIVLQLSCIYNLCYM